MVVGPKLRKQDGSHDGSDLSLPVLQGGCVSLATAGVLAGVKVLMPANQFLDLLCRIIEYRHRKV